MCGVGWRALDPRRGCGIFLDPGVEWARPVCNQLTRESHCEKKTLKRRRRFLIYHPNKTLSTFQYNHIGWQNIAWTSHDQAFWYGITWPQSNVIMTPSYCWSLYWLKTCCICTLLNYPNSPCLGFLVIIVWCWPFFHPNWDDSSHINSLSIDLMINCGLMMTHGIIKLGQHWFR